MVVDLIVNPASGRASRAVPRAQRLRLVSDLLRAAGATVSRSTLTRGAGDAHRAAQVAVAAGADRVLVWGGDGTVNEVADALAGTRVVMALVAGGSGNGFALGLGLPRGLAPAVDTALHGAVRDIDVGVVDGRTFVNVAGIGFDAAIAARVNTGNSRRGLWPYVQSALAELRTYEPTTFTLTLDDGPAVTTTGHQVVVCNGMLYGPGARIAPGATFDDGWLDVVALPPVTTGLLVRHGWRLLVGALAGAPGVVTGRAKRIEVTQARALPAHLDGEVLPETTTRVFEIRTRALRIAVPAD